MNNVYSDILNLSSEAAVVIHGGRISFANASALSVLGCDCTGKAFASVFPPEITESQSSSYIADVHLAGKPCICRVSRIGGDTFIFISSSSMPSDILNEPFFCTVRNSLMAAELSVNLMMDKAESIGDKALIESIAVLTRSNYRMINLVNNASFIIGAEEQLSETMISSVNISEFYSELICSIRQFIESPEISYECDTDIVLNAEPRLIMNLLFNLISNCVIHAKDCSRINISLRKAGESVVLSVSDDGCGIEEDDMRRVFERYRYGFDLCAMGKGVGLGLSVVRKISQLHGGTLLMESRPGRGTAVRVSFSGKLNVSGVFHSSSLPPASTKDILLGLSNCLPVKYYYSKFMD